MPHVSPQELQALLKGDRCFTDKCAYDRRPYAPGQPGRARKKVSRNTQCKLREKQKTRRIYGILERQFHGYCESDMQRCYRHQPARHS